jgi:hypothetical protein
LAHFWKSLHSSCFLLATSSNLSSPPSSSTQSRPTTADPTHPLTRVRSQRSLRGMSVDSTTSSRPPTIITTSLAPSGPASPLDYSSIARLLKTSHSIGSATAVLEGVPMLLALDRSAEEWIRGIDGREKSNERAQAIREIVGFSLRQIGKTWRVREIEQLGQDVSLLALLPMQRVVADFLPPRTTGSRISDTFCTPLVRDSSSRSNVFRFSSFRRSSLGNRFANRCRRSRFLRLSSDCNRTRSNEFGVVVGCKLESRNGFSSEM